MGDWPFLEFWTRYADELSKRLKAIQERDKTGFVGSPDFEPHHKERLRELDRTFDRMVREDGELKEMRTKNLYLWAKGVICIVLFFYLVHINVHHPFIGPLLVFALLYFGYWLFRQIHKRGSALLRLENAFLEKHGREHKELRERQKFALGEYYRGPWALPEERKFIAKHKK